MVITAGERPVTTPEALMVALAVLDDDHTPPELVLANVMLLPTQTSAAPVIALGADGSEFTETAVVAAAVPQPLVTV